MLIAVKNSTNRNKSASTPENWKPRNELYWCEYALDWIRIKHEWGLTVTQPEWNSLLQMINSCPVNFSYKDAINHEDVFDENKILMYEQ